MDALRVAVCEDDQAEREALSAALAGCGLPAAATVFPAGEALLAEYSPGSWDLILMDIFMGGLNGVETVARIRTMDPEVPIAFLTTSPDFTMEGYRYRVDRYLLKPVKPEELREVLELAERSRQALPAVTLSIQGRGTAVRYTELRYAEQLGHVTHIFLTGGRQLTVGMKLSELAAMLPVPPFYQCHKSFLVNLGQVRYLDNELRAFIMNGGGSAYIRRGSLREAQRMYSCYVFEHVRGGGK